MKVRGYILDPITGLTTVRYVDDEGLKEVTFTSHEFENIGGMDDLGGILISKFYETVGHFAPPNGIAIQYTEDEAIEAINKTSQEWGLYDERDLVPNPKS